MNTKKADLRPRALREESQVRVSFCTIGFAGQEGRIALVVRFKGRVRSGSQGRRDCRVMQAYATAGVIAFQPSGLILDFTDLKYCPGAEMERVFQAVDVSTTGRRLPLVLLASKEMAASIKAIAEEAQLATEEQQVCTSIEGAIDILVSQAVVPSVPRLITSSMRLRMKAHELRERSLANIGVNPCLWRM